MKAAVGVLADTESHADLGRVTNALQAAKELARVGDAETVGEFEGHPSVHDLVADGYEIVTY